MYSSDKRDTNDEQRQGRGEGEMTKDAHWSRICRTPSRPRRAVIAAGCGRTPPNAANSARQIKSLKAKLLIGNEF
jgi:hypothetical protein